MVKKYLAVFTAAIALSTVAFGAMAQQGVSNAKIDADVKKATGTLDDMQKLGKKIEARHSQEVATQRRSARQATVRQAVNRAANSTRRAANTARRAANAAKNTTGKKAAGKKKTGN